MTEPRLRPELVSLIHHVELHKEGWWDRAIGQFILAAIWFAGHPLSAEELRDVLRNNFSISTDTARLDLQVDKLRNAGNLVRLPDGRLKVSEQCVHVLEKSATEFDAVQAEAQSVFTKHVQELCPEIDLAKCWSDFNSVVLFPLVREIGARTYELISGSTKHLDKVSSLQNFLQGYPTEMQSDLRNAIVLFMNPNNSAVRSYILRHLNAYFFIEASELTQHTLDLLSRSLARNVSFDVFVDTNFLFSILGLHENPSNEAAASLMSLISKLTGKVTAKLYLFPLTVDEFKRVLKSHQTFLSDLRLEPNLALVGMKSGITGVALKFIQESKQAGRPLKAADYFGPYLEDLIPIIRSKGLELYNVRTEEYTKSQEVIDDILIQQQHELQLPPEKRKSYESLLHDVSLWHFVKDKRPVQVESANEAKYWIVTVDYRFLGFDAYKRRSDTDVIPVVVHPTTLVQLLQLWLPRTAAIEEAIVRSMRFAFLFHEFDSKSEEITVRILESLSRFENVRDLSEEAVTSVLMNQALRSRLHGATSADHDIELVREALIEENNRAATNLREATEEKARLAAESKRKDETIAALEDRIEERNRLHEESMKMHSNERDSWEQRIKRLESNSQRRKFVTWSVCLPITLVGSIGFGIIHFVRSIGHLGFWWSTLFLWGIGLTMWVFLVDRQGSRNEAISGWTPFIQVHRFKNWLFALFVGPVPVKLAVDGIYKLCKLIF